MYKQFIIGMLTLMPIAGSAQLGGLLKRAKDKVAQKVNQRVDHKMDKAIENGLDKAEGKEPSLSAGPVGGSENKEAERSADKSIKTYGKYDFVPGEKIIYSNDFATDPLGELPTGWNSNGTGAVVNLKNLEGKWARLHQNSVYLIDNSTPFTENFTVEFDLVLHQSNENEPFPQMAFGLIASGDIAPTANELLKGYIQTFATELKVQPGSNSSSHLHLSNWQNGKKYLETDVKKFGRLEQYFNTVIHVAMQVQKERLRIWLNETKLYDLPKAIAPNINLNQLYFDVKRYGGPDEEVGYAIGNIKIAEGLPDTRHKLIEEGKFSTTGILFDVNKASIKPESEGVIKEVADVLLKYKEIKVKIIGHTDSDGNDAANLELSKKRALAVKEYLSAKYEIEDSRMECDGKGEQEPVSNNSTREGKAQNRRVEFVKQ